MENKHHLPWALVNKATTGVVIVTEAGEILLANDTLLSDTGYTAEELKGNRSELLLTAGINLGADKERKNGKSPLAQVKKYVRRKDGSGFWANVSTVAYSNADGRFTALFISDAGEESDVLPIPDGEPKSVVTHPTASIEKERELNELKSRFLSVAAHEFRTPLSTILSSAFLMSRYTSAEDQPKRDRHIDRIVSSAQALSAMLNDFMSVAKIEEDSLEVKYAELNLHEITSIITSEKGTALKANQELKYYHTGRKNVLTDESLYKHILTNLLSNAIKFSDESSIIEVFTEVHDEGYILRVKDYGIGIPPEDQKYLFQRFFRGSNALNIKGAGLGLHIVGKYAERMQATVAYSGTLGKGSEFTVSFKTPRI